MTIEYKELSLEHSDRAFELATRVFVEKSTLHSSLQIGLEEYRNYLKSSFTSMVSEGLSVVAINVENQEVIGCLIATDFFNQIGAPAPEDNRFQPLVALTKSLCIQYLNKRSIHRGETVLIDMAAVSEDTNAKGIYQHMRAFSAETAKRKGFSCVVGELSSAATQHVVLNKLGHKIIAEIAFHDFEYAGEFPFRTIKSPTSIVLAEGYF